MNNPTDLPPIPPTLNQNLLTLGIELDPDCFPQLAHYLQLLYQANQQFNLTAIKDLAVAWDRHILDSLTLLPGFAQAQTHDQVIDIGSGGGLPAIPLAITRPDLKFILVEATGKKAKFLEETAEKLKLQNVKVINTRAETLGQDPQHRQQYPYATCRAVGPMNILLEYTLPLLKVGGQLLAMKGPALEEELKNAADALTTLGAGDIQIFEAYTPQFKQNTLIAAITKQDPTPTQYPRLPGTPKQDPL